jgi:hypothetical protein
MLQDSKVDLSWSYGHYELPDLGVYDEDSSLLGCYTM